MRNTLRGGGDDATADGIDRGCLLRLEGKGYGSDSLARQVAVVTPIIHAHLQPTLGLIKDSCIEGGTLTAQERGKIAIRNRDVSSQYSGENGEW